jgi:hypothetical protein
MPLEMAGRSDHPGASTYVAALVPVDRAPSKCGPEARSRRFGFSIVAGDAGRERSSSAPRAGHGAKRPDRAGGRALTYGRRGRGGGRDVASDRDQRTELTAGELRAAAARSRDAQAARRMLALALVLEGVDRKTRGGDLRDGPADAPGLGAPGWPGSRTTEARGGRDGSIPGRQPSPSPGWRPAPTLRWTGWCAGGGRT